MSRLDAGLAGPLTLIAAPAGFGKTTLLAAWLTEQEQRGTAVAWLALDAADADPIRLLRYLIAALQAVLPGVGQPLLPLLGAGQLPPLATLLPLLVNDLLALPDPSILVLDDYHTIDAPAVHQALAYLLDHLPPQLHLVLATRVDPPLPLARLRARGQLTELRADDLRFSSEEAATFLREVMGLSLSVAEVVALEGRTEGWVAGLQLAALSLRDRPSAQRTAFIDAFTGSHRFVVDYLVDEVLARQPAHLQHFLLHTAILERLCSPLCDAVVRAAAPTDAPAAGMEAPAASQAVLEQLERNNLFVVPLDEARRWYRYHHLFAQMLRERLASSTRPEVLATLHRRASAWFEAHGLAVDAVQHALAGHDWERAAHLVEAHAQVLLARGQVHTVLGWLHTLPAPLAQTHPLLNVIHAGAFVLMNELAAAERRVEVAEQTLPADPQDDRARAILGTTLLTRAYIAFFRGDLAHWLTLSRRALELLPPTDVIGRPAANLDMASDFFVSGDVTLGNERRLVAAVAAVRASGHFITLSRSIVSLAELQRRQGRLRHAATTYGEAVHALPDPVMVQAVPSGAAYYFGLGDVRREWNDLAAAEPLLTRGRAMVQGGLVAEASSIVAGYRALARLHQARGDARSAQATLAELAEVACQRTFADHLHARVTAVGAQVALMQGQLAPAVQWADTSGLRPDDDVRYLREHDYLALARVRIAQGRQNPAGPALRDARHLLDRLLAAAEAGERMDSVIEILVLQALAVQAQGDVPQALAALERALMLAAPEGYVRVFVDEGSPMVTLLRHACARGIHAAYAAHLLAQADVPVPPGPAPSHATPHPLPEPLSAREMDVLRLLAAGRSNQAIADELVVAVGTVKRHISSSMGKLQAESRLDAVARARDLHLL